MSLTPTLCAMLQDELLRERYVRHLDRLIDSPARDRRRTAGSSKTARAIAISISISSPKAAASSSMNDNAICFPRFASCRQAGALEIIACAATTRFASDCFSNNRLEAARAQVLIGRDVYVEFFGAEPADFGCRNAPTLPAWNRSCRKRTFAGSFSMHMD